jgi:hypothetical protein
MALRCNKRKWEVSGEREWVEWMEWVEWIEWMERMME